MVRVLFVCMGNICRSPLAEAVFRQRVQEAGLENEIFIDSVGTAGWHEGSPPHALALEVGEEHGYTLKGLAARAIQWQDYDSFDRILAMDKVNLATLLNGCPETFRPKIDLYLNFTPKIRKSEIPDPYGKKKRAFAKTLKLIETGADGLLDHIRANDL